MPLVLSQSGLLIQDDLIIKKYGNEFLIKLRKSLTITFTQILQEKIMLMYKTGIVRDPKTNNTISFMQLPRFLLSKIKSLFPNEIVINKIPIMPNVRISCKKSFKLYNNQKLMMTQLFNNVFTNDKVKEGTAGCIAKMGTGQGKTYLAAAIIGKLKKKTLVIVHDKGMRDNEFSVVFKDTLNNLKLCVKNKDDLIKAANVVILVINTAMNKPPEFFKQFGLIIMDEVHMYCSEKRSQIFWKANCQYMLGMSATPDEKNDLFWKLSVFSVGPIIDVEKLEGYEYTDEFKGEVLAINYYAPDEYVVHETNKSNGMLMTHKTIEKLLEDPYRDGLLMKLLGELLADPKHYIYVFCQHRNSIMHYYRLIKKKFPVFSPEAYPMMGGISDDLYNEAKEKGRVILITYSYGGTGKSISRMTAAIFASPMRSNWKQITGRILRLGSDTDIVRKYIDIIDANTMLRFQFYGTKKDNSADKDDQTRRKPRREVYYDRGFTITYENIKYEDIEPYNETDE